MAFAATTGNRVAGTVAFLLITVAALPVLVRGIRAALAGLPVRPAMRQATRELAPAIRALAGVLGSGCVMVVALGVILVIGIGIAYAALGGAFLGALFGQRVAPGPTHGESVALTIAGIVLTIAFVVFTGFLLRAGYVLLRTALGRVAPAPSDTAPTPPPPAPGPPRNDIAAGLALLAAAMIAMSVALVTSIGAGTPSRCEPFSARALPVVVHHARLTLEARLTLGHRPLSGATVQFTSAQTGRVIGEARTDANGVARLVTRTRPRSVQVGYVGATPAHACAATSGPPAAVQR